MICNGQEIDALRSRIVNRKKIEVAKRVLHAWPVYCWTDRETVLAEQLEHFVETAEKLIALLPKEPA